MSRKFICTHTLQVFFYLEYAMYSYSFVMLMYMNLQQKNYIILYSLCRTTKIKKDFFLMEGGKGCFRITEHCAG
jgi:hypothetical protein